MHKVKNFVVLAALAAASFSSLAQATAEQTARKLADEGRGPQAIATLQAMPVAERTLSSQLFLTYLLTDNKQFKEAVEVADAAVKQNPTHAGARLAYAYALRHSGATSAALKEYQEASRIEPKNQDALMGQVLMLNAVGAPVLAQELAISNKLALPQATLASLKHSQAIQLIRTAPVDADLALERKKVLAQAIAILQDLSKTDSSKTPDLIAALSRDDQHKEAIALYQEYSAAKETPKWLKLDIANSYAALKYYGKAIDIYEDLIKVSPNEPEIWLPLFYQYADTAQMGKAQQLIDNTLVLCNKNQCTSLETLLTLQVYSRLWTGDTESARSLVVEGLTKRPGSRDLKSAYVAVLGNAGLKITAREQVKTLITQYPEVLDFRLSKLTLEDPKFTSVEFETELKAIEKAFPGNLQVARVRRDWQRSRAPVIQATYQVEQDESSRSVTRGLKATTAALNPQGLRLVAATNNVTYDMTDQSGAYSSNSLGALVPLSFGTELEAHVASVRETTGWRFNGRHQATDKLALAGNISLNDDEVPYKGLPTALKSDVYGVSADYRISAGLEAGASARYGKYSDGNTQIGVSGLLVKSGVLSPDWGYRWTNRLGVDTNSRQDVAYFSPKSVTWGETEFGLTRKIWLSGDNYVTFNPKISVGFVDQEGYGALPLTTAGAGLIFKLGENATLELNANVMRKPYDGEYSVQTIFGLLFTWVWY